MQGIWLHVRLTTQMDMRVVSNLSLPALSG